jgi:Domain of Unknown Function (DUF1206)
MVAGSARRRWSGRTSRGGSAARRAGASTALTVLARTGLAARGVMYILIGAIAVQVAFGHSGRQADRAGALPLVASTPFGAVALWLLVIGFTGMALWRLSQAIWGTGGQDGRKPAKRLAALARAVFYGVVTFGILKYAIGLGRRPPAIGSPRTSPPPHRTIPAVRPSSCSLAWVSWAAGATWPSGPSGRSSCVTCG